jgi:hypothetical protein
MKTVLRLAQNGAEGQTTQRAHAEVALQGGPYVTFAKMHFADLRRGERGQY